MLTTTASFRLIARDLDRSLETKSEEPEVARESAYYLENIGNIKSVDDFMADTRIYNYAMQAFGLEDMAYAKAFMRKILEEGVAADDAFVNKLSEDRFVRFAEAFNFERDGEITTTLSKVRQPVVDLYVRQKLEVEVGEDNEGVRLALYFQREAPKVDSAYDLLADAALWQVVKTVFGFPDEMAAADIDKQAAAVLARLDIEDLADPDKLDRLVARFTAMWDATEETTADPVLGLFGISSTGSTGIDLDLIMTLSNIRRGGA